MGTHSGVFAWKIPWVEEHGGLQSVGSQRVKHNWVTNTFTLVTKLCPNLCDPADCSLSSSSLHGIFQARMPEWVAIFFFPSPLSPGSSQFKDQICFSYITCGLLHCTLILYCWDSSVSFIHKYTSHIRIFFPCVFWQFLCNFLPQVIWRLYLCMYQFSSVQSVMSDSLWSHGL